MTGDLRAQALDRGWRPGLIGDLVGAQARYYAGRWGFGTAFEATIADGMARFASRYDPLRDLTLSLSADNALMGACTIDGSDPALAEGVAHLRWFMVTPAAQGLGLGRRLLGEALAFADHAGYRRVYLDTFAGLGAARRLYDESGFVLTHEEEAATWGRPMLEQRMERTRPA